ncbi:MAG: AarF/ABC1/UbiB kinase family protein [Spirochaetes bacterium]|nr:AarF/ABC1/UbiB kinase family protein [Spirochaetota bacterium]
MAKAHRPYYWKTQRHLNRYKEIISVLIKYGFGDILQHPKVLVRPVNVIRNLKISRWERIRRVLEELGITFIKLGQLLSNRPDLLPPELVEELEKLQSDVPPFPTEEAIRLIESEYGVPLEKRFVEFSTTPIAAASIAQVHTAVLPTGESVVVKVQRPGLEEVIRTDLEIMRTFAHLIQGLFLKSETINPLAIIDEFGRSLEREIDFWVEAAHLERFANLFADNPHVYVPRLYKEYTTRRVLVMERIQGIRITDVPALLASGNHPKRIARFGAEVVLEQVFRFGFFHADPHPGNMFVLENDRICFIDFGMMGVILPRHREILNEIMVAMIDRDERRMARGLLELASRKTIPNLAQLEYDLYELLELYGNRPLKDIQLGELIQKLLRLILFYHIPLPPGFFLLSKALVTMEGVGLQLDPEFNLLLQMEPIVRKMFRMEFSPESVYQEVRRQSLQIVALLRNWPFDLKEIVEKVKEGRLVLELDSKNLVPILREWDIISNRLSFSIVLAALVVGSSIVINAKVPPLWGDFSVIGVLGFLVAGLIGFWLLLSILRKKKM